MKNKWKVAQVWGVHWLQIASGVHLVANCLLQIEARIL